MSSDWQETPEAYADEEEDRPFGDVQAVSRRTLQSQSLAYLEGAANLLSKGLRAWREDRPKAIGYVGRAAALPFDRYGEFFPGAMAASILLSDAVIDELEESPEDDLVWLGAALTVLEGTESSARFALRDVLNVIAQEYVLTDHKLRLIREAVSSIPPRPELQDLVDLTPDELRDHIVDVLDAWIAYEDALSDFV